MRWRQTRASQNVDDYRGRPTGGGGGMKFGIVGLVAIVGGYFLGIDPRLIMGLLGGGGAPASEQPVESGTPTDEAGQFVAHVLGDTEDTWTAIFAEHGDQYPSPHLAVFDNAINTGCGAATSAAGPFYCPADNRLYIDLTFFRQLETEFAAQGDFAKAYVIAHEVGHHVQTITGISDKVRAAQQQSSEAEANALQVKMELQADCYAGIWAFHADSARQVVESGDVDEALTAASSVGDDTIQKRVQGHVNQESFTHGSGAQRQEWFSRGLKTGRVQDCNTFQ
jgi:predicted metalloprotease